MNEARSGQNVSFEVAMRVFRCGLLVPARLPAEQLALASWGRFARFLFYGFESLRRDLNGG